MGERLLAHALDAEEEPLRSLRVASAGLAALAGDPPSSNAVTAMRRVGIDISDHRSRRFHPRMFDHAILMLPMTVSHLSALQSLRPPDQEVPIHLYREFCDSAEADVPDPFGGNLQLYLETRDALAEAVPAIIRKLKQLVARSET